MLRPSARESQLRLTWYVRHAYINAAHIYILLELGFFVVTGGVVVLVHCVKHCVHQSK